MKDIPFPGLREQLQKTGDEIPDVGEDYTLQQPEDIRGRVAFGALPWLMHDQPFVQGLTACAEIGEAMARAVVNLHPVHVGVFRLIKGKAISTQQTDAVH